MGSNPTPASSPHYHAWFDAARHVVCRAESYGSQHRGRLMNSDDPFDGFDPGPYVDGNLYIDCAIGLMVNGPVGTAINNVTIPGHFHTENHYHGQGGVTAHIGKGLVSNNLRLGGPAPDPAKKDWKMPDVQVSNRTQKQGWEWDRGVKGVLQGNNVDRPDVVLDSRAIAELIRDCRKGTIAIESLRTVIVSEARKRTGT